MDKFINHVHDWTAHGHGDTQISIHSPHSASFIGSIRRDIFIHICSYALFSRIFRNAPAIGEYCSIKVRAAKAMLVKNIESVSEKCASALFRPTMALAVEGRALVLDTGISSVSGSMFPIENIPSNACSKLIPHSANDITYLFANVRKFFEHFVAFKF